MICLIALLQNFFLFPFPNYISFSLTGMLKSVSLDFFFFNLRNRMKRDCPDVNRKRKGKRSLGGWMRSRKAWCGPEWACSWPYKEFERDDSKETLNHTIGYLKMEGTFFFYLKMILFIFY